MATPLRLEQTRPSQTGRARGLVSAPNRDGRICVATYRASPDMRHIAAQYWSGRWNLDDQPPHKTEMLGDPCAHVVFERGPTGVTSRLVGIWTRLWQRTLQDVGQVRGVKLCAGAFRAIVDESASRFANRIVPLTDLFDEAATLQHAVMEPDDDGEGFAVLEAWLRRRATHGDADDIQWAMALVETIAATPDITTVAQLAETSGDTLRSIQRLFRDYVGASPKWVIRRNRLQEVAARIERGQVPTLTTLANELGYADQAHLTRDFKSVVGKTPTDFARSVQR